MDDYNTNTNYNTSNWINSNGLVDWVIINTSN